MKKLAICIPNYNRSQKLGRLLVTAVEQIDSGRLYDRVEICVSDDCSTENIKPVVEKILIQYPRLQLKFHVNPKNMGMDYNFVNCVQMADAEFCWIIGNDDLPAENGLKNVLVHLENKNEKIDILVCPFDVYDEHGTLLRTIYPLKDMEQECLLFHTADNEGYCDLIERINDGNAIFCFLSNVVFRRAAWIRHGNMFMDKMDTIFIQMYMNLQTLKEGAVYKYIPDKFIKNYVDDEINATFKREYEVLIGLNGVVDYFFEGEIHRKIQKCVVDDRINGRMWDLPEGSVQKQLLMKINSPKSDLYKKYFIESDKRANFFGSRNVLVYGAGDYGKKALIELESYNVNSLMVFDADPEKWGSRLEGHTVCPAKELYSIYYSGEYIVVVANNKALIEIVEMLQEYRIEKIVIIT